MSSDRLIFEPRTSRLIALPLSNDQRHRQLSLQDMQIIMIP